MKPQLPRIAISEPTSTDPAYNQRSLPQYIHAVEAAGGEAVPIPLTESQEAQARLFGSCSAILLPGSPADIDPTRYGQLPVTECAAKDAPREAVDDLLLIDAFAKGKPILGVCYGLQSMNVWSHGSLIQDLPHADASHRGDAETKVVNHQPGREVQDAHAVLVTPGSRLFQVLASVSRDAREKPRLTVNSSHHQAIDLPGKSLTVAAKSLVDGVIEALEGSDSEQFVVGVQWHPERSYDTSAASRALFAAFLEAARSWKDTLNPGSL